MLLTVSIIEDNPEFLALFKTAIAEAEDLCQHLISTDCASARQMLNGKPADVLLVDLGLPDGSGLELIREAAQAWPNCEIMVVSVFGNQENVLAALEAGATGYLLKDDDALNLVEQIRVLKAGGSPISPMIARKLLIHLNGNQVATKPKNTTLKIEDVLLSQQEITILSLSSKGYNYQEVANLMGITPNTVATHVKRCYRKLQVNSKSEAIYEARKHGLVKD